MGGVNDAAGDGVRGRRLGGDRLPHLVDAEDCPDPDCGEDDDEARKNPRLKAALERHRRNSGS